MSNTRTAQPITCGQPVKGSVIIQVLESVMSLAIKPGEEMVKQEHEVGGRLHFKVGITGQIPGQDCLIRVDGSEMIDPHAEYSSIEVVAHTWNPSHSPSTSGKAVGAWMWQRNLREQMQVMFRRKGHTRY